MIKSMTGFASLTDDDEAATITVTVRSVNHRFLDLQLRLPPTLAAIEPRLRALVQQRVARGRVEVMVAVQQRRTPALADERGAPRPRHRQRSISGPRNRSSAKQSLLHNVGPGRASASARASSACVPPELKAKVKH